MAKMVDYRCKYSNYKGIDKAFVESLGYSIPDMYKSAEGIASYAKAVKERDGKAFCQVIIDSAVEAEAMGASVIYDESPLGPRPDSSIRWKFEDIAELPEIDLNKGRIPAIFEACDLLRAEGEKVEIEMHGMFGILNAFADMGDTMMMCVKNQELIQTIADKIKNNLLIYAEEAKKHCDLLQYSDGAGGINVLGPKMGKRVVKWFVYPFMKEMENVLKGGYKLQMCPKTAFMLVGTEKARYCRYETGYVDSYMEACTITPDDVMFFGQRCNKEMDAPVNKHIDYLELL